MQGRGVQHDAVLHLDDVVQRPGGQRVEPVPEVRGVVEPDVVDEQGRRDDVQQRCGHLQERGVQLDGVLHLERVVHER